MTVDLSMRGGVAGNDGSPAFIEMATSLQIHFSQ
jgi:hypothetical protein